MAFSLLLADDKPAIAKIISLSLPKEEFNVEAVTNGKEALARIEASPPQFLLIDVSLPYANDGSEAEKDGLFITRHIKTHPGLKRINVILLTNAFEPVDEMKRKEYQADGVLIKPFDPSELRARLKQLTTPDMVAAAASTPAASTAEPEAIDIGLSSAGGFEIASPTTPLAGGAGEPGAELSPVAQELASFFANEIEANSESTAPPIASAARSTATPTFGHVSSDSVTAHEEIIELEPTASDLNRAAAEWRPRQPSVETTDLSQWQSHGLFDTGDSNFEFSQDYLARIGTRSPHSVHRPQNVPAYVVEEATPTEKLRAPQPTSSPRPAAASSAPSAAPSAATAAGELAISAEQIEAIVREEARRACQDAVDKVAWEVIPELAENIIRRELDKVLAELDREEQ